MKIARFVADNRIHLGLVRGNAVTSLSDHLKLPPPDMTALIRCWKGVRATAEQLDGTADFALNEIVLLAPIARPGKILGIGLNYSDHIAESGQATPDVQLWFTKAVTSVNAPYMPIQLPRVSAALDYEAELVAVIGQGGKHIAEADAADAIFGYCVGNDVSVRDWQTRTSQHMIGKSFDTHAPIGPWIVTADEIDPHQLDIRSLVNGELRQTSNTRHLIFNCYAQVAHLSQAMTLEPGDLLFTGTPGGVGAAYQPPRFLAAGDRVRIEIDGIGAIENVVEEEG